MGDRRWGTEMGNDRGSFATEPQRSGRDVGWQRPEDGWQATDSRPKVWHATTPFFALRASQGRPTTLSSEEVKRRRVFIGFVPNPIKPRLSRMGRSTLRVNRSTGRAVRLAQALSGIEGVCRCYIRNQFICSPGRPLPGDPPMGGGHRALADSRSDSAKALPSSPTLASWRLGVPTIRPPSSALCPQARISGPPPRAAAGRPRIAWREERGRRR